MKSVLLVTLMGTASLVGGCASVPMASAEADAKAKTFVATTDGNAELYVYRNESLGSALKMPLLLDNTSIGDTGPHTFVLKEITPGKHTIVSKTESDVSLDINAQPGQTYYVWQEVKMGVWTARSALHQVDEKTGQQAVKECKLVQ